MVSSRVLALVLVMGLAACSSNLREMFAKVVTSIISLIMLIGSRTFFCKKYNGYAVSLIILCLSSSVGDIPCNSLFQSVWVVCKSGGLDKIIDHVDW